jgi:hypothetical protein
VVGGLLLRGDPQRQGVGQECYRDVSCTCSIYARNQLQFWAGCAVLLFCTATVPSTCD